MKASKVVTSVIYNYLSTGFITVTGFAYTAFIVHRMSHGRFGIFVLTSSIIGYSNVLDLGIGVTVQKMVAEPRSWRPNRRDHHNRYETRSRSSSSSGPSSRPSFSAWSHSSEVFSRSPERISISSIALAIAAGGIGISFPSAIYTTVHQAHGDYRYLSALGICSQALQVGVGMTLFARGVWHRGARDAGHGPQPPCFRPQTKPLSQTVRR